MKVLVRGPVLSKSGYGEHARQVALWALSRGHDVRFQILNWGITPWYLDRSELGGLVGQIMDRSGPFEEKPDLSLQIQLPNEWDPNIANVNVGITAGVEADKCSQVWKDACNNMSLVIVPSSFSKTAFVGDELKTRIEVVPEAYCSKIDDNNIEKLKIDEIDTKFNFLLFGQITGNDPETDRKNLFYTVKWFCEEFHGNKDVGLIIKSNMGTNCVFHKKQLHAVFKKLVTDVRRSEYPRVYLLSGDMSDSEVAGLMKSDQVHCMLSLTRGEGYGLPLVDAAASGLPIVATNWSGHLEFLSKGHFTKVEYDLVKVNEKKVDGSIFVDGAKWAMPKEVDSKKRMRKTFESYAKPVEWAKDLQPKIKKEFSIDAILLKYDEIIGKIL
jgi:glycosyltransferase involved in cell wall biosynthesis